MKVLQEYNNKAKSLESRVKTETETETEEKGLDHMISLGFFKHYVEMGVPDKYDINNLNVKVGVVLKEL